MLKIEKVMIGVVVVGVLFGLTHLKQIAKETRPITFTAAQVNELVLTETAEAVREAEAALIFQIRREVIGHMDATQSEDINGPDFLGTLELFMAGAL